MEKGEYEGWENNILINDKDKLIFKDDYVYNDLACYIY